MGMDIYGKNPQLLSSKPEIVWETSSDEAKSQYFKVLGKWEKDNPGYYFRANIWSWRPIQMVIEFVNEKDNLELDLNGFDENSGCGLDDQEECNNLANSIENFLNEANLNDNEDSLYLCLGMWTDENRRFKVTDEIAADLNKQFSYGQIIQGGVVGKDGNLYYPAWGTSKWHLDEFINFLRHCGGFEIW